MEVFSGCSGGMRDRCGIAPAAEDDRCGAQAVRRTTAFHATGVAQIAKKSEVAVGQIYRDFDAKEEIVAAIVETDCRKVLARESLHRAISLGESDVVRDWIRQFIVPSEKKDSEALFAEIIAESARNGRIAAIFKRADDEVRGDMLAALALIAPGSHLAERRSLLASLILAQSLGLMQHRLLHREPDSTVVAHKMLAIVEREIDDMNGADDINDASVTPRRQAHQPG